MKIAYDLDAQEENDPYVTIAEHVTHAASATTNAGSYLVDTLPFCKSIRHS